MQRRQIILTTVSWAAACALGAIRAAEPSSALAPATAVVNVASAERPSGIVLKADGLTAGKPLVHFWSTCVGAGRANEGLRASWLEQLKTVVDACGFRYVRFHGLFHDDMFVYREVGGKPVYNWQYIDDLFDRMLAIGVRPFVELGFVPQPMASGTRTTFWWKGNTSPPKDNARWAELVGEFVKHCIARYGEEEVVKWYFEVWNEPDLQGFWDGTKTQYFELYKVTARAVKAINPHLRVGGPSTSNYVADGRFDGEREDHSKWIELKNPEESESLPWRPVWVEQFMEYCRQNKVPVDFISTHPYPTDFAFDPEGKGHGLTRQVEATPNDLRRVRMIVDADPYPKVEIHLTEWSSSPSPRDFSHDCLPAAAFVVKANLESAGLVDSLSYWTFTDVFEEKGAGDTIFHGGFGMINYQGIVKPTFHAYRFLHALGDEILSTGNGGVVTRDKKTGRLIALVYNYPSEVKISVPTVTSLASAEKVMHTGSPIPLSLTLAGLKPNAPMLVETLDSSHGNAIAAWEAMGKPPMPTREQIDALRKAALATKKETLQADESGRFTLQCQIEPWSLVLIEQK